MSGGRIATFSTSFKIQLPCTAKVFGTKGEATLPKMFYCSEELVMPEKTHKFPLPKARYEFNYPNSSGLRYEIEHVRECLKKNLKESPVVKHEESLMVAEILEDIRKQAGVAYDQD